MISNENRGDTQGPLAYFEALELYHFYRVTPWNDMKPEQFDERTIKYTTPVDLYWKLRKLNPDIVQGPEPFSLLMLPFLAMTLLYLWIHPRVRLVTLSLEPIPLGKKYHPLLVPLFRLILWFWFRRARVIFWLDTASKRNLLVNGADPRKLVSLMYGSWGIDPDEFTPDGPRVDLPTEDPVILYVGRLSPGKGVTYLLDAYKLLLDRGVRAHLAIVGDGSERAHLEEQARALGVMDRITWFGTIKHVDLPPYLRTAQFLVLPSITLKLWVQQLSQTAWQAMGCGLPVISTQTGCMAEFTPPETGILVPERDAVALADAMQTLLNDPARLRTMSAAARAYALERFDAKRNVRLSEQTILEWCS
jgi:glycosyltransferase involved in cell wall biosynthesis